MSTPGRIRGSVAAAWRGLVAATRALAGCSLLPLLPLSAQPVDRAEVAAGGTMLSVVPAGYPTSVFAERRFDAASGLRASTVFAMHLDREGTPWIGADDGLYVYAGGTWRLDPLPDPYANQQVRSLLVLGDGGQWVGTRRGALYRPPNGIWQRFDESDGLPGAVVFSLIETRAIDGTRRVVAGGTRGVSWFDGNRFVPLTLPAGMNPLGLMLADGLAPDGRPELWVASSLGGLARLHGGRWELFTPAEGLATPDVQYVTVAPGPNGGQVYGVGAGGVFVLDRARGKTRFELIPGSPRDAYRIDVVPADGDQSEVWVGLVNGEVHRFRAGQWSRVQTAISERHGTITLLKAVRGHGGGTAIYASSRSGYLVRLSRGVAAGVPLNELESSSYLASVFAERDRDGRDAIWVGTLDRGLVHLASGRPLQTFPLASANGAGVAAFITRLSLAPPARSAPGDSTLVLVADSMPWRFNGARFERFSAGLGEARVLQLAQVRLPDGREAVLAGTTRGVRLWNGTQWEPIWPTVTDRVSAITGGMLGGAPVVYLGGRHRVHVVTGRRITVQELPRAPMGGVGLGGVRRICAARGTSTPSIFALDTDYGVLWRPVTETAWRPLPPQFGRVLSNLGATDLLCLSEGRLAVSTFTGLSVFDVSAGDPEAWRVATQVSDADGLPASGVVAIARSAAAPNVVWTATTFGIGVVDIEQATRPTPARLVVRVMAENGLGRITDGATLRPTDNDLRVEPMLLSYHREELTRFRVRLAGPNERTAATETSPDSVLRAEMLDVPNRYYNDLAPGRYELAVWAYDWAGREYGPVRQRFSLLTPWWQTWPARLGYLVGALTLLTIAYRWRIRTVRANALQLLESERRVLDSERRFRAIFEQAIDGHLLAEDGRVQAANVEAARLFGVPDASSLVGRTLASLLGEAATASESAVGGEATLGSAEEPIPVAYSVIDVPSAERLLRHVVLRDLTEVRKAEAERAWFHAQVREAQKLESLGTLAGGVAHDFNNLLGVIRGNAELGRTALRRGRSNDDNLGAILDASDRARDIVRQILTFSRRSTPTREYVNLSRIVLDLQPLLRRMIPRTVTLVIEGAEETRLVMGDPTQLQQLLLNLVSNAEYAMRNTTNGLLTITLSSRSIDAGQSPPIGRTVVLQVRDTGAGMSEEVRARIFEPFFTTKPTGEGTGLGMAVVHGIVTSHGGRAEVFSAPGAGTTFEIRFPEAEVVNLWDEGLDPTAFIDDVIEEGGENVAGTDVREEAVLPKTYQPEELAVLEDSPYAGTTVVVVDDEPAVAAVVERALQHYGHVVHVFTNPELALQFIQQQPSAVDLLITDQTMPGLTGDLLAEQVHALRGDLPVLILTGFSHRLTPERIAAARAHAVMLKPVELTELKRQVDDALASASRR